MLSEKYLELGLTGLARCVHAAWESHFPAAVLAGYYYAANNRLSPEVEHAMSAQLDRLVATKSELFKPYPKASTIADSSGPITDSLAVSIDKFSELGHNAIFAGYALRALHDLGGTGRESIVRDIALVVRQFDCGPARYWLRLAKGHDPRKFTLSQRTVFTDGIADTTLAQIILDELTKFRNVYTQMGSKSHIGHLLTQSHALLTLRSLGYAELANRGFYSLECRFLLLKDSQPHTSSSLSFYRPATRSPLLPSEAAFWQQDFSKCQWDEGHSFKYTFSFYELLNLLPRKVGHEPALDKFRYLISPNERSTSI